MLCAETLIVINDCSSNRNDAAITKFLAISPVKSAQRVSQEELEALQVDRPVLVLAIYDSPTDVRYQTKVRVRPNNFEYLDLFVSTMGKKFTITQLSLNDGPERLIERLSIAEQKVLQRYRPRTKGVHEDFYLRFNLIGNSSSFKKSLRSISRVAKTDSRVIIRGETGTGKEIAARSIHHFSQRSNKPFVPINCGAFSDDLLLSELFGHTKGAFTGAEADRKGLIEHADSGTLFLDEVDELSSRAQVALLRFLQEGEIRPLGSRVVKKVNIRVLSASNKSLKKLVKERLFREDLLYRLDVLSVTLLPLRSREDDIFLVAQRILGQIQQELEQDAKYLSLSVIETIKAYEWPGNFREIESALLRAFLMCEKEIITDPESLFSEEVFEQLPRRVELGSFSNEKNTLIRAFEKSYIQRVLSETGGNVSKAANIANKERRAFTRLMTKYDIRRETFLKYREAS